MKLIKPIGGDPSELCINIAEYLGCDCEYFPVTENSASVRAAFEQAVADGQANGYIPVLITVDDNLVETIALNVSNNEVDELGELEKDQTASYRESLINNNSDEAADEFFDDAEVEPCGEITDGAACNEISLSTDCCETLLAKIPVKNPWELAAWLPMGGWNDCPDPESMIAVAKKWYEKYGAVICAVSGDQLAFRVETPVADAETACKLAEEHEIFCSYCLENNDECTRGAWTDSLMKSTVWNFWWD